MTIRSAAVAAVEELRLAWRCAGECNRCDAGHLLDHAAVTAHRPGQVRYLAGACGCRAGAYRPPLPAGEMLLERAVTEQALL